ncbi:hypothetical protein B0H14DRAFT_2647046 [Mycena olivaceomarginata]|nr:hypothetical protein B0H14DRAFT_2647046 [Mycena olivaceomarginata]
MPEPKYASHFYLFGGEEEGRDQTRRHLFHILLKPSKSAVRHCATVHSPLLPAERVAALMAAITDLKASIPHGASKDDKASIARAMGRTHNEVSQATQGWRTSMTNPQLPKKLVAAAAARRCRCRAKPAAVRTVKTVAVPRTKVPDAPVHINEYDKYSALVYHTVGMPSERHIRFALVASAEKLLARVVTLIIYAERAIQPVFEVVFLRFLGCFQFGEFRVAKRVNAVGRRAVPYERYSIFERAFTPENPIQSINMLERGSYMIYKLATLPEAACLDLAHWKATAHASAANNNDDAETTTPSMATPTTIPTLNSSHRLSHLLDLPPPQCPTTVADVGNGSTTVVGSSQQTGGRKKSSSIASSHKIFAICLVGRNQRITLLPFSFVSGISDIAEALTSGPASVPKLKYTNEKAQFFSFSNNHHRHESSPTNAGRMEIGRQIGEHFRVRCIASIGGRIFQHEEEQADGGTAGENWLERRGSPRGAALNTAVAIQAHRKSYGLRHGNVVIQSVLYQNDSRHLFLALPPGGAAAYEMLGAQCITCTESI